jgi:chitinase
MFKYERCQYSVKSIIAVLFFPMILLLGGCSSESTDSEDNPNQNSGLNPGGSSSSKVSDRMVGAYCTYYGTRLPNPSIVTYINYAFAELYMDGDDYVTFKLKGSESKFLKVVDLKKQNPGLKILLSFSNSVGNSDNKAGGGFSALCKSAEYRKKFAEDCIAFMQKYGIDGIDMDWEYPGIAWSTGIVKDTKADVDNYTLLMKQLRTTFGSKYLLTFAGATNDKSSTSDGGWSYIDIKAVEPYVDYINIMAYDLDKAPHFQSALSDADSYRDCKRGVNVYLNDGVSSKKLVLGIPFYGRHDWSDAIAYRAILALDQSIYTIDNWYETGSVPYVSKDGAVYYTYDNAKSIGIKGKWALSIDLGGMFYWECNQDDDNKTLSKAVWNSVMSK